MKKTVIDYSLKVRLPLTLFIVAVTFILTFYISRAERDSIGYAPEQPIKYSHKLHAGEMQIDCQYCHTAVTKSRHAVVPSASICMNCHSVARKDKPEIIKLTKYYEENKPIPWKRVHKIPDYAYFNHSVHVNKGIECESCHGEISEMEVVTQARGFTMTACLECHRNPEEQLPYLEKVNKGPENCAACHR
ncbi:MAG: cytochrome c3 family protein [Melioribacteraceae bacterium]|nr:cytochrome c3 family protein [Melioribacteraceae bacterium]